MLPPCDGLCCCRCQELCLGLWPSHSLGPWESWPWWPEHLGAGPAPCRLPQWECCPTPDRTGPSVLKELPLRPSVARGKLSSPHWPLKWEIQPCIQKNWFHPSPSMQETWPRMHRPGRAGPDPLWPAGGGILVDATLTNSATMQAHTTGFELAIPTSTPSVTCWST